MLTGIKDLDFLILNKLNDTDLISFCSTNNEALNLCNNQTFWKNRTINSYEKFLDIETMTKFKGDRRWSDYYIELRENINSRYPEYKAAKAKENNRYDIETLLYKIKGIEMEHIVLDDGVHGAQEYYVDKKEKDKFIPLLQGKYKVFHPNGNLMTEGDYINTKRVGTWKNYFDNGNISLIENYKNKILNNKSIRDGEEIAYDIFGKKIFYRLWKKGVIIKQQFF